jgi:hypothetical protein
MKPQPANPNSFTNFPDTLLDPHHFREEQNRLAKIWTFLGFTHHVAKDGDWFRASNSSGPVPNSEAHCGTPTARPSLS